MDKQVERIRIKDIAQMAEVSVGTVGEPAFRKQVARR